MSWPVSGLAAVVFLSGASCTLVGLFALRERPDPMSWPLALLMFSAAAWAFPHSLSLAMSDPERVLLLHKLWVPAATSVPVFYLVLAVRYAGYDDWFSARRLLLLFVIPLATTVVTWTNGIHGLFWRDIIVGTGDTATVIAPIFGPWYWVSVAYAYLLISTALFVFVLVVLQADQLSGQQAVMMFLGGAVPTAANAVFHILAGLSPSTDFTTTALAVSGITFAVALFRYDLFKLSPAAYQRMPKLFGDGVLVFDGDNRLVEFNDHAERILETQLESGQSISTLFDDSLSTLDGTVLTTENGGRQSYLVHSSPLRDHRGDPIGHAVAMREITELKQHEERLGVANRILRHNLRNELNIVLMELNRIESESNQSSAAMQRLRGAAHRLEELSEKSRHIRSSLEFDEESLCPVDIVPVVETVLDRYRERYPEAEVTFDAPDRAVVFAPGQESVDVVVRNLVENALEHNDKPRSRVEVSVDTTGSGVDLRVSDNGPGIPSEELSILDERHETQLQHGSSLGLWLVHWLTSAMGGGIEFETNDPHGTVVTLTFRASSESGPQPERTMVDVPLST